MKKCLAGLLACVLTLSLCGAALAAAEEEEEGLSEDLYSFQVEIDGEVYAFPMSYEDFTAKGWECKDDETELFEPNQYTPTASFEKDGLKVYVYIINQGIDTVPLSQCAVGGLSVDSYQYDESTMSFTFPGGIAYGEATLDDITAAYGPASDTYEGDLYTELTYEYDYYQDWEFYVDAESGVLNEFDMRSFATDEQAVAEAMAAVENEPTEEVLAYTAPEELGTDPLSFVVEYAGDLYQMPAPVSAFVDNGWTLKAEDSDGVIVGKGFGWVSLIKDNQELYTTVRNYSPNAATIENCFITSVEADRNGTNLPMTIPGGVTMGMAADGVAAALEGVEYEMNDTDSDYFIYYTIESPDSTLDGLEIRVDREENAVSGIEVEYEPDELTTPAATD